MRLCQLELKSEEADYKLHLLYQAASNGGRTILLREKNGKLTFMMMIPFPLYPMLIVFVIMHIK